MGKKTMKGKLVRVVAADYQQAMDYARKRYPKFKPTTSVILSKTFSIRLVPKKKKK